MTTVWFALTDNPLDARLKVEAGILTARLTWDRLRAAGFHMISQRP